MLEAMPGGAGERAGGEQVPPEEHGPAPLPSLRARQCHAPASAPAMPLSLSSIIEHSGKTHSVSVCSHAWVGGYVAYLCMCERVHARAHAHE